MVDFPGSKINLGLYITEKRQDGYHNLETVFFPTSWTDVLEIIPSESLKMDITGLSVAGKLEDNLCMKAWKMLYDTFSIPPVHIHLHKVVPMGAGLGGGSADGAAALKILNSLFDLHLNTEMLQDFAQRLGSDCAFFIEKKPVFAHGRGECMEPLVLSFTGYTLAILYPGVESSTASAYRGITVSPAAFDLKSLPDIAPENWKSLVLNQFRNNVGSQIPVIGPLIESLYELGALYAEMSGSGSAVFGLFKGETPDLQSIQQLFPQITLHTEVLS